MTTIVEIEPAFEAALKAAGLADFDAMMRAIGGEPVGWHHHRETLPIEIAVGGQRRKFFLKRVFEVPPKHALWPLFRLRRGRSQPWREWHVLRELEQAGIPVMRRVAFGERQRLGLPVAAFLLVEAVPMRHTLENWLVPGFPKPAGIAKRVRDRLVYELGALVGRLHAAGFVWPDIHAKHVFAAPKESPSGGSVWEFRLIDVERMTVQAPAVNPGPKLPADVVSGQLRLLRDSIHPMPLGGFDLRRFFAGYFSRDRRREPGGAAGRQSGRSVSRLGALPACSADGASCPRLPDDYEHPRHVGLVHTGDIQVEPRVTKMLTRAGLRSFQDILESTIGKSLRKPGLQSYRDRIRLELPDENGDQRVFFLKRYVRPPLREQLRRMWETSRSHGTAWREVHFAKELARQGIPTVRMVAFGERMRGSREVASFGIAAEVRGESLETLAMRAASDPAAVPAWRDRREIIRQLALIVRRLHENELFHRDLYLCHVFLTRNAGGEVVLQVIDLARMLEGPWNSRRWRVKDLASLHYSSPAGLVTRADRLRFLYYYHCGEARGGKADRCLIGEILARARRMASHDASRARRFARARAET
jgi:hypothetical protein